MIRAPRVDDFDPRHDVLWMAENETEATHVWRHKCRLVLFFSAMRHFRDERQAEGLRLDYHALDIDRRRDSGTDFAAILRASGATAPTTFRDPCRLNRIR